MPPVQLCRINPKFVRNVKDLQVIKSRWATKDPKETVGADVDMVTKPPPDLDADREKEVAVAVDYLNRQLHKSVASVLGPDDVKVVWTQKHEKAFQDCIRCVAWVCVCATARVGVWNRNGASPLCVASALTQHGPRAPCGSVVYVRVRWSGV